ncbi:MAG: STAS domain-containing protein [Chlamydiales bacterium]|nr:STAS domain-containing protein [Chlamydiales bacterium]
MNITEEKKGEVVIVHLQGRLDANSSPAIESKINELTQAGSLKILIDMHDVDYLSSAGMRVLLSVTKKLKSVNGKLGVFALTDDVMDIIKMAGFHQILFIAPSEEEAIKAL